MIVIGIIPSIGEFVIVKGVVENNSFTPKEHLKVEVSKKSEKGLSVNEVDYFRLAEIASTIEPFCKNAQSVFVKLPSKSRGSDACISYGAGMALVAGLNKPTVCLTATDFRKEFGKTKVLDEDYLKWGLNSFPNYSWDMTNKGGVATPLKKNHSVAACICAVKLGLEKQKNK